MAIAESRNTGLPVKKRVAGFLFQMLLFSLPLSLQAREWMVQDKNLKVSFNDVSRILQVTDKRCNKVWEQYPLDSNLRFQKAAVAGNTISLHFDGKIHFDAFLMLSPASELEITLSAPTDMPINAITFPGAFKSPFNHYLLLTDGEGLLLPVNDKDYPLGNGITFYCGGGLSMPWMGITDKAFATGYMAILETPYDAALKAKRQAGAVTFEPVWLSSKEAFGYNRKVTYVFFDKGGYVAQCKRYRSYIWQKNTVITLQEKRKKTPAIDKMMGGPHIYVWDDARTGAFAKELKDAGIAKAMLLWNPNHLPYPAPGYDDSLKAMGFAVGAYELFTDENIRDTVSYDLAATPAFLRRNAYPGMFNQIVARKKNGTTYTNRYGTYINPKAALPEVQKRSAKEMAIYPHETYFLDVYQANGLYEDYSEKNSLTREQWAKAIMQNQQYLMDKYNVFLGGEWGADYCNSQISYAHGMMTLQRTWFNTEVDKPGTIYYIGNWRNSQRPSIMLGTRTAPPIYMKYSINEALRAPLYELVYHDAVVTSWRWEDGAQHTPDIWWKKDMYNILYGTAPLWTLDRDRWESFKNTFVQSYQNICPWLQQIGYDEMVTNRFVTEDGKVQESVFSSGKKVVVNFGDVPFDFEKKTIAPRGFIFL